MRGVFLDLQTVDCNDLDLEPLLETLPEWDFHPLTDPVDVTERIAEAEVVVLNKVVLTAAHIAAAPRLQLICTAATGTNNIDLTAATQRGIPVCNARDYATDSVVQHVFAMLLTLVTRMDDYRRDIALGRWQQSAQFCLLDHPIRTVAGMRMGIVGSGALGQATARVATAMGMHVEFAASLRPTTNAAVADRTLLQSAPLPTSPSSARRSLDELLPSLDVLSLHCPLTPETQRLMDATRLARLPQGSFLLNTARGGLVDAQALADSLRSGHLGGAGIDVLDTEPPPPDHPLLAGDIPNLVLTPHTAWAARSARQNVLGEIRANLLAYLASTPRNVVNTEVLSR
jgi:glycerate dehydrogenase